MRAMRTAISPRFAMRILSNTDVCLGQRTFYLRARSGFQHLARKLALDERLSEARRIDELVQVNAGIDVHVFKHVHEVLCGNVARSTGGIGASAHTSNGGIEVLDAHVQGSDHVG